MFCNESSAILCFLRRFADSNGSLAYKSWRELFIFGGFDPVKVSRRRNSKTHLITPLQLGRAGLDARSMHSSGAA